ncbi:class I SAM-dependent RNA methyltransferase [Candidatus Gracilibacteria bacterium]|nr:class I SAM-dependent RNA methyltransferase [Candidatus Gracilibacteria bacterium]
MYSFLLTCPLGLEALAKKDIEKQGYKLREVQDKAVYFNGEIDAIARINLWSRFGNIVYFIAGEYQNITDFDSYFDAISQIDWLKYIPRDYEILVKATSIKSELGVSSSLQGLAKKAIVKSLVGDALLRENPTLGKIEIRILMENNTLRVLLNTSGEGLHKRGYREMTGDAPLKENIAAALVILSGWKFREPLYDIFCGSGTIGIEAAMIARNIAPGLKRKFACETWSWIPQGIFESEKKRAKEKEFSGEYKIYSTDIRKDIIELARRNAKFAGVDDCITFGVQDYTTYLRREISGWLISNPPYGLRLEEANVPRIHQDIAKLFEQNQNLQGGIITAHSEFESYSQVKYKRRKLYNGGEQVYFYKKEQK